MYTAINRRISPIPPPSPPALNMSSNNGRSGGDTPNGGDDTSTNSKITPPNEVRNDAHNQKSGDIGGSGDIFRLSLGCGNSTDIIQLDGKDYVAFNLEWRDSKDAGTNTNQVIYAAAFVDNYGNQKVLQIDHKNLSLFWLL